MDIEEYLILSQTRLTVSTAVKVKRRKPANTNAQPAQQTLVVNGETRIVTNVMGVRAARSDEDAALITLRRK